MKQQIGIITTGSYSSYRIVATLSGPIRPALSTLEKQFSVKYNLPKHPEFRHIVNFDMFNKYYDSKEESKAEMKLDTLIPFGEFPELANYFVAWLIRDCGFEEINAKEVNI